MIESPHRFVVSVAGEHVYEIDLTPSALNDPDIRRLLMRAFLHAIEVATPGTEVRLETVARDPAREA